MRREGVFGGTKKSLSSPKSETRATRVSVLTTESLKAFRNDFTVEELFRREQTSSEDKGSNTRQKGIIIVKVVRHMT